MARPSNSPLQPNPFLTYRDPDTGAWVVIDNGAVPQTSLGSSSTDGGFAKSSDVNRNTHLI